MVDLKKVIEEEMPGWTLVTERRPAPAPAAEPDMSGFDDEVLRKKYRQRSVKSEAARDSDNVTDSLRETYRSGKDTPQADEGVEWGQVREKNPGDAAVGTKTVLYDKKTGKVKSAQG
jgi:hypothetical protein